jgi:hypothetical protein
MKNLAAEIPSAFAIPALGVSSIPAQDSDATSAVLSETVGREAATRKLL